MGAGCCAHLSSRKFRPLDSDMDVIDTAMAYESDAGELIIPLFVAWADHVGSTCIRRVGGTDVTVRVPRDEGDAATTTTTTTSPGGRGKDVLKILYGPNTIPLLKVRPGVIGATSEDPHVVVDAKKGTRVKCKVFEFSYNYVSNIMHVWRLWYPLETLASPDSNHPPTNVLPYKVTHRIHSSVRRDETIVWEIAEGEDNSNNVERNHTSNSSDALPCVQYVMTAGAAGGAPSSDQPSTEPLSLKKICFLSLKAPGWVVQVGERTELIVDYHVNPDMSLDAFLVKPLNKGEELLYLAHVSQ